MVKKLDFEPGVVGSSPVGSRPAKVFFFFAFLMLFLLKSDPLHLMKQNIWTQIFAAFVETKCMRIIGENASPFEILSSKREGCKVVHLALFKAL